MSVFTNQNELIDAAGDALDIIAGAAKVDGSAVTQPISAVSLPLPTGAATEATLATRASEATLATLLLNSTFTARVNVLGQNTMANSTPVVIASNQSAIPVTTGGTGVATVTTVALSTTVATLSASNAAKTRVIVHNDSGGIVYVKLGSGATTTDYSYRLTAQSTLEIDGYYGIVTAIRATGTSDARVTEVGI